MESGGAPFGNLDPESCWIRRFRCIRQTRAPSFAERRPRNALRPWRRETRAPGPHPPTHHSPLTTHHSPLTTHHSPLTTHHSPLTTHHSPLTTISRAN